MKIRTERQDLIHIAFTLNDVYAEPLRVLITSILASNRNYDFSFHIVSSSFSLENRLKNKRILDFFKNATIDYFDANRYNFFAFRYPDYRKFPPEAFYQYILADLLPEVDKVLYLDVDIVVQGDIGPLWRENIQEYYCVGVTDYGCEVKKHKYNLGLKKEDAYINSGVVLYNLKKIRDNNKVEGLFKDTLELGDALEYADQDGICYSFRGGIKLVDSIYNFGTPNVKHEIFKRHRAIILHYLGRTKPWRKWNPFQMHTIYYRYEKLMKHILDESYSPLKVLFQRALVPLFKDKKAWKM